VTSETTSLSSLGDACYDDSDGDGKDEVCQGSGNGNGDEAKEEEEKQSLGVKVNINAIGVEWREAFKGALHRSLCCRVCEKFNAGERSVSLSVSPCLCRFLRKTSFLWLILIFDLLRDGH